MRGQLRKKMSEHSDDNGTERQRGKGADRLDKGGKKSKADECLRGQVADTIYHEFDKVKLKNGQVGFLIEVLEPDVAFDFEWATGDGRYDFKPIKADEIECIINDTPQ